MKTTSWEIIIAGFLFVGLSIFLIESATDVSNSNQRNGNSDSLEFNVNEEKIHVFKLESLEKLENLKNLENLENLQNLENLKNLKTLLPMEIRAEFESEIDQVIKELDQESLEVNFDVQKKTLTVDPSSVTNQQGWTVKSPGVYLFSKSFESTNNDKTNLSLPFGSVDIVGNSEGKKNLIVEASGNIATLDDLRSRLATETLINDESTTFNIISRVAGSSEQNIQIQSQLEIPEKMNLDILTKAGHIDSKNIQGVQSYLTNGGHITLDNLTGTINANTGGGHIQIENSEGQVTLITSGGNIRVQQFAGDLNLQSGGGNLQVIDQQGKVEASTNGGNIEIRSNDLNGSVSASTGAGSITLWIKKNANVQFDLSGSNIEVDPQFEFNGTKQTGTASGVIGSGEHKITAKTNYGSVSIKAIN